MKQILFVLVLCVSTVACFAADTTANVIKGKTAIGSILMVDEDYNTASYQAGSVTVVTSNPSVFSVVKNTTNELQFIVTAIAAGTATGTVTMKNSEGTIISQSFTITVKNKVGKWIKIILK